MSAASDDKPYEYAYSLNEEDWEDGGNSPEAAIEAATFAVSDRTGDNEHCDHKAGDVVEVWIGRCVKKAPGYYVRGEAEYVIERAGESAGDDVGDYAEDWPSATKEQTAELDESIRAVFEAWCVKHKLEPTFYSIVDVQKHEVVAASEDDVALDDLIAKGQGDSTEADDLRERIVDAHDRAKGLR